MARQLYDAKIRVNFDGVNADNDPIASGELLEVIIAKLIAKMLAINSNYEKLNKDYEDLSREYERLIKIPDYSNEKAGRVLRYIGNTSPYIAWSDEGKLSAAINPSAKNVVAPAPNVPIDIVSSGNVFLNYVVDGAVVSSHKIQGNGGTEISTAAGSETDGNSVIKITSSCVRNDTFIHNTANITIDTGFTETPKIFKLYYWDTNENKSVLVAECCPELPAPFNCVLNTNLPIAEIEFNGGTVTINCHTSTGLSMMWEAYI